MIAERCYLIFTVGLDRLSPVVKGLVLEVVGAPPS